MTMIRCVKSFSFSIWIFIFIVSLGLIAVIGDRIVLKSPSKLMRVIADSLTHSLIGAVTWLVVCIHCRRSLYAAVCEICISGFFSSIIDVDHFMAARSFKLKDALNLPSRPFLHCSSVSIFTIVVFIFVSNILELRHLTSLSWIILVAFTSHHIRDAAKHGFWIWPLGSTPPLQYFVYIVLTMSLPIIVIYPMDFVNISSKSSRNIYDV